MRTSRVSDFFGLRVISVLMGAPPFLRGRPPSTWNALPPDPSELPPGRPKTLARSWRDRGICLAGPRKMASRRGIPGVRTRPGARFSADAWAPQADPDKACACPLAEYGREGTPPGAP